MAQFQLEIMTPDGVEFSGECESLLVRSAAGDVEIMRGHADYFSAVETGRVRIIADGKRRYASASGGFISVSGGRVMLAPVTFEFAEDIDEQRRHSPRLATARRSRSQRQSLCAPCRESVSYL